MQLISISNTWNDSLEQADERPVLPRNKIWASELGKSDVDIYLKMMGTEPSNPFDARARRKFEAGNLFEWIVQLILMRAGIYQESQRWVGKKLSDDCLEVSGKLDHVIGGAPVSDMALEQIQALNLPPLFTRASSQIISYFKNRFPHGVPAQGIEVKSTSSYGIEKVYFTGKALAGHDLQAFHYAYETGMPFSVLYICRDDLRMAEIPIMPDDPVLFARYKEKIERVSGYYNRREQPPKEPEIIFDHDTGKFSKNFNVEYSSYLKLVYKIDTPDDYDAKVGGKVESWNRVLTRIKDGKDMTDNNLEKLAEMEEFGIDFNTLGIDYAKLKGTA